MIIILLVHHLLLWWYENAISFTSRFISDKNKDGFLPSFQSNAEYKCIICGFFFFTSVIQVMFSLRFWQNLISSHTSGIFSIFWYFGLFWITFLPEVISKIIGQEISSQLCFWVIFESVLMLCLIVIDILFYCPFSLCRLEGQYCSSPVVKLLWMWLNGSEK